MTDDIEPTAPPEISGKAAEYVEKLVSESFKRELDQEENVVRSLPFFATSIGVLMTLVGFARSALPALTWEVWSVLAYGFLAGILISLAAVLVFLYQAVYERRFLYPMAEPELIGYATQLTGYYEVIANSSQQLGDTPECPDLGTVDALVVRDVRAAVTKQAAEAAVRSRSKTLLRLKARARAFSALLAALAFALGLIVVILSKDALTGGVNGQLACFRSESHVPHRTERGCQARPPEAGGASNEVGCQGSLVLRGGSLLGQGEGR